MELKKEIIEMIKKAGVTEINLEIPPDEKLGDYAFPCFELSKKMKKNPNELAKEIAEKIEKKGIIKKIEVVGGYINFFLDWNKIAKKILNKIDEKFGAGENKEKVLIEHTSINPNASPHVGRARNALIGDTITRILRFAGYNVEVHYYVNDVGKQVAMLVLAAEKYGKKEPKFEELLEMYIKINKEIKENPSLEKEVFELLRKVELGDEETIGKFKKISSIAVNGQMKILNELGIHYDVKDYESKYILESERLKELIKKFGKRVFKDEEGRYILDLSGYDLPLKSPVLVLTRADGTSLYPLRDIAYTIDKLKLAKKNILVLGEDQKTYFKQIAAALDILGYPSPKVIHYSFVLLKTGKMSTRKGNVVLLTDFMSEAIEKAKEEIEKRHENLSEKEIEKLAKIIGYGALKYNILKVSQDKIVIIDWEEALNFEGNSAPYVQYTYVRAKKILEKINEKTGEFELDEIGQKLFKKLIEFPEIIEKISKDYQAHQMVNYAYELANLFNEFYEKCPVIKEKNEKLKNGRILLVKAYKNIIKNCLNLLGIFVPEFM